MIHVSTLIGEMDEEKSESANRIDDHANVKRWVRSLTHESAGGFSLPLLPGRLPLGPNEARKAPNKLEADLFD